MMSNRIRSRIIVVFIMIIVVAVARAFVESPIPIIPREVREIFREHRALDAILVVVVGVIVIQVIASSILIFLKPLGKNAYIVRNIVLVLGYMALAFAIGVTLGLSSESILASATFSGLVIGLALQPILSNFFSGLIILVTGYLKPGQEVRIAGLPLSLLSFPAYKFFSRDIAIPSIRGVIVEIGLIHTRLLDIDGNLIKISNTMLLNNSMVLEEVEEEKRVQIRYEFPLACSPDDVLTELHSVLKRVLKSYRIYIEEQSDKQNYIVLIITSAPPKTSVRAYRSVILKEIIKIHRKLLTERRCGTLII